MYEHVGKPMEEKELLQLQDLAAPPGQATTTANLSKSDSQRTGDVASEWKRLLGKNKDTKTSLAILQQLSETQNQVDMREYQNHIADYVTEWDRVVTTRIDKDIESVKLLQSDRTHYEVKVERLRKNVNELQQKEKPVPKSTEEKLDRNEEKLKEAWTAHEAAAGKLCVLMEAATQGGWRDLYHLVKNTMKWESNRVGRLNDIYLNLPKTLESMKSTYNGASNHTGGGGGGTPTNKKSPKNANAVGKKGKKKQPKKAVEAAKKEANNIKTEEST